MFQARGKPDKYRFTFEMPQNVVKLNMLDMNIVEIENEETLSRLPHLHHHLDKITEKPGIYTMEEMAKLQPDKGAFLRRIYQPDEVALDRIPEYVPPSKDPVLLKFARDSQIKYLMSTSTVSSALS